MPDRRISERGDDALLAQLAVAMAPDGHPAPGVDHRRAPCSRGGAGCHRRAQHRLALWAHRKWAVAAAAVALLTLGTGTAFAAGVPVPPAVRVLATDIGLPITPQPVVDVRNATSSLQQQLRANPTDPLGTALAASHLAKLIEALPASQQSSVPAIASQLLHQACQQAFPSTGGQAVGSPARTGPAEPTGWAGCPTATGARGTAGTGATTTTGPTTSRSRDDDLHLADDRQGWTTTSTWPTTAKGGTTTSTWPTTAKGGTTTSTWPTSPGGHPDSGGSGRPTTTAPGGSTRPGRPTTPTTWPGHGAAGGSGQGNGRVMGSDSGDTPGSADPERDRSNVTTPRVPHAGDQRRRRSRHRRSASLGRAHGVPRLTGARPAAAPPGPGGAVTVQHPSHAVGRASAVANLLIFSIGLL